MKLKAVAHLTLLGISCLACGSKVSQGGATADIIGQWQTEFQDSVQGLSGKERLTINADKSIRDAYFMTLTADESDLSFVYDYEAAIEGTVRCNADSLFITYDVATFSFKGHRTLFQVIASADPNKQIADSIKADMFATLSEATSSALRQKFEAMRANTYIGRIETATDSVLVIRKGNDILNFKRL